MKDLPVAKLAKSFGVPRPWTKVLATYATSAKNHLRIAKLAEKSNEHAIVDAQLKASTASNLPRADFRRKFVIDTLKTMTNHNQIDLPRVQEETFVRQIEYHDEVVSTNDWTIDYLKESANSVATPLLVITPRQTGGRGRGANRWWSGEGGLTFTLAIDVGEVESNLIAKTSLTVGLAICQTLEMLSPFADFGLKWPNDVYLDGRKVCGILIEKPSTSPHQLVIGIGINVNNSVHDAPDELKSIATALVDHLEVEQDLTSTLIACLKQIENRLEVLWSGGSNLLDQWQAYDILRGSSVVIDTYSEDVRGICRGIDAQGALLIEQDDGQTHRCLGGVVRQIG